MAKDKLEKAQAEPSNRWQRVRIKRAIALGGLAFRPRIDGGNVVPVEAVILAAEANLHGPDYVEVLADDVRPPADGIPRLVDADEKTPPRVGSQDVTPDNKQTTGGIEK